VVKTPARPQLPSVDGKNPNCHYGVDDNCLNPQHRHNIILKKYSRKIIFEKHSYIRGVK